MAAVDVAYCTPEDVRKQLQDVDLDGPTSEEFVKATIVGESEWVQEETNRHWFATDSFEGTLAIEPLTHDHDEQDIPSSPHADHVQAFRGGRRRQKPRYPVRYAGPYTRVALQRRDVSDITELLIRQQDGSVVDWVDDDRRTEGRGEDYYVQVDDASGRSHLYLHTGSLPHLSDFDAAVTVSYEYGTELTQTVRTAVASIAAAKLLRDDEQATAIPDSGQLVSLETKADTLYKRGLRLLEIHR